MNDVDEVTKRLVGMFVTDDPDEVRPIIACVALNPEDYSPGLYRIWTKSIRSAMDAGEDVPRPYQNSTTADCVCCGITLSVGPKQTAQTARWVLDDKPFEILCLICATLAMRLSQDDSADVSSRVHHLGNTERD